MMPLNEFNVEDEFNVEVETGNSEYREKNSVFRTAGKLVGFELPLLCGLKSTIAYPSLLLLFRSV